MVSLAVLAKDVKQEIKCPFKLRHVGVTDPPSDLCLETGPNGLKLKRNPVRVLRKGIGQHTMG